MAQVHFISYIQPIFRFGVPSIGFSECSDYILAMVRQADFWKIFELSAGPFSTAIVA